MSQKGNPSVLKSRFPARLISSRKAMTAAPFTVPYLLGHPSLWESPSRTPVPTHTKSGIQGLIVEKYTFFSSSAPHAWARLSDFCRLFVSHAKLYSYFSIRPSALHVRSLKAV